MCIDQRRRIRDRDGVGPKFEQANLIDYECISPRNEYGVRVRRRKRMREKVLCAQRTRAGGHTFHALRLHVLLRVQHLES